MLRDKIKEMCKERGITIKQLERDAELGEGTIKKWSDFNPRLENVVKVADVLGVSVDDLIREEPA